MKKDRSFSNTVLDSASTRDHQSSPVSGRKTGGNHRSGSGTDHHLRQNASSSRLRVLASSANTAQMAVDLTIFHIPGLDVKVYYESKTVHEDASTSMPSTSLLPGCTSAIVANTTSSPASSVSGK